MFARWWAERFGEALPAGHALRKAYPDRWVRFHSLPESKRYAENKDEREEILRRQRLIAAAVLGDGACYAVTGHYLPCALGTGHEIPELPGHRFVCELHGRFDDALDDGGDVSFLVTTLRWDPAGMRDLLLAIANDEVRVLWIAIATGEVFAPYDGGGDCILATRERRDELRARHAGWLSALPSGL
jgi:hypothetical protein